MAQANGSEMSVSQINQSEAGPGTIDPDDALFKHPQNLDYLESISSSTTVTELSRQSLYTKFDPLVSPPKEVNGVQEMNQSPAKNPAIEVLDRLISLSPAPKQPVNVVSPLPQSKTDNSSPLMKMDTLEQSVLEIELAKLHELLVKQEKVSNEKLTGYDSQVSRLTGQTCLLSDKLKEAEEREKALAKKVTEQNQSHLQLSIVMQEYEKLISKLTADIETEKKNSMEKVQALTTEKESALGHLSNVEAAFTDVHHKYEKCKKVIDEYKKNEGKMKSLIGDQTESLRVKEKQLETVQAHAEGQLEHAHREVERVRASHEQELTRLRALLRKTELKVISLQESLEQKIKENQELTTICDDLIEGKVGSQH